jgi:hypothetical protein
MTSSWLLAPRPNPARHNEQRDGESERQTVRSDGRLHLMQSWRIMMQ